MSNQGQKWTEKDRKELWRMHQEGKSSAEISKKLQRTADAISRQLWDIKNRHMQKSVSRETESTQNSQMRAERNNHNRARNGQACTSRSSACSSSSKLKASTVPINKKRKRETETNGHQSTKKTKKRKIMNNYEEDEEDNAADDIGIDHDLISDLEQDHQSTLEPRRSSRLRKKRNAKRKQGCQLSAQTAPSADAQQSIDGQRSRSHSNAPAKIAPMQDKRTNIDVDEQSEDEDLDNVIFIAESCQRSGAFWSAIDVQKLTELVRANKSNEEAAKELGRSLTAVQIKVCRLGGRKALLSKKSTATNKSRKRKKNDREQDVVPLIARKRHRADTDEHRVGDEPLSSTGSVHKQRRKENGNANRQKRRKENERLSSVGAQRMRSNQLESPRSETTRIGRRRFDEIGDVDTANSVNHVPENQRKKWHSNDVKILSKSLKQNKSWEEIAEKLGRSVKSVKRKWLRMQQEKQKELEKKQDEQANDDEQRSASHSTDDAESDWNPEDERFSSTGSMHKNVQEVKEEEAEGNIEEELEQHVPVHDTPGAANKSHLRLILREWHLEQYYEELVEVHGFEDINDWQHISEADLREIGWTKLGHMRKFMRKTGEYFDASSNTSRWQENEGK